LNGFFGVDKTNDLRGKGDKHSSARDLRSGAHDKGAIAHNVAPAEACRRAEQGFLSWWSSEARSTKRFELF
jgi:hypothetical protein